MFQNHRVLGWLGFLETQSTIPLDTVSQQADSGCMSDRLHDHLTFGFRRGCVACAQAEADFALMQKWTREHAVTASPSK